MPLGNDPNASSRSADAEVGPFVGQRKLSITADVYTHVPVYGREIDLLALLAVSA